MDDIAEKVKPFLELEISENSSVKKFRKKTLYKWCWDSFVTLLWNNMIFWPLNLNFFAKPRQEHFKSVTVCWTTCKDVVGLKICILDLNPFQRGPELTIQEGG